MAFRTDAHGDQFYALTTFRRDGTPVSTPMWLAPAHGRYYAYTPGRSWKVRRLRHTSAVQIAPSDFHGTPRGPWRQGQARILPPDRLRIARRAMRRTYGFKFLFFVVVMLVSRPRKLGGRAVGLEITLDADVEGGGDG